MHLDFLNNYSCHIFDSSHYMIEHSTFLCYNYDMNTKLSYIIGIHDAQKSIAEFLLDHQYSSRLVVHLRNTPNSFLIGDIPVFSNYRLSEGEHLSVILSEKKGSEAILPVPMDLSILYEDEHILIINKPPNMPVHPSQGNYGNTLANGIAWYMKQQQEDFVFRAVNRLDRDTSGLLVVAKNMLSSCILSEQIKEHKIHREYSAIVCGQTAPSGTITVPIARKDGSTIERIPDPEHGESAVTHYKTLAYQKETDLSFLRLLLETGRTHQIRVHMKYIGHPLPGDFLYHPDNRYIQRQALHSAYLRFTHPLTGTVMEFEAPIPEDMQTLFPSLRMNGRCF